MEKLFVFFSRARPPRARAGLHFKGDTDMTHSDCLDCLNRDYCEHTSMDYCRITMSPAWMAHRDFYDPKIGECSKLRRCTQEATKK